MSLRGGVKGSEEAGRIENERRGCLRSNEGHLPGTYMKATTIQTDKQRMGQREPWLPGNFVNAMYVA